jgi:futalosine hydrolase
VLVPTELERRRLSDLGGLGRGLALEHVAGFGVAAAAARTMQLLSRLRPARVLLIGIAGSYDPARYPIGSALEAGEVAVEGIGAGEGDSARGPAALGFPQCPGSEDGSLPPIEDRLPLACGGTAGPLLLTTCSASDGPAHAARRRARFPEAALEDMEGFAVALACALEGVPLRIVRGVSNEVGLRDPRAWRIPAALAAARTLALEVLAGTPWPTAAPQEGP